jgi:hypothetical protein
LTVCEAHGVGERIVDRKPLQRRTPHGVVRYDETTDQLVEVDQEEA